MEDYNIQIIKYKDCNEILRTKILNTLFLRVLVKN